MRKLLAHVLCLALVMAMLSGCSQNKDNTYDDMMALLQNMSEFSEGEFQFDMSAESLDESESDNPLAESLDIYDITGLTIDGQISTERQIAKMSVTTRDSEENLTEMADLILIGDDTYINISKMMDGIALIVGYTTQDDGLFDQYVNTLLDGNEYLYSVEDESWTTQGDTSSLPPSGLVSDYFALVKEHDAVTYEDNVYTITLTGDDLKDTLVKMVTDFQENSDVYANYISDILSSSSYEDFSSYLPSADDMGTLISDFADGMLTEINDADLTELTLTQKISYDENTSTYCMDTNITSQNEFSFDFTLSLVNKEIGGITAPSSCITVEELQNNMENFSSGTGIEEIFDSGDTDLPAYEINTNSDISTFVNRDLTAYDNLESYDFTSDSGKVYSVARITTTNYNFNEGMLSSESPGMIQYFMPYPSYDETAKEFLQWYVEDDFNSGYSNPAISDIIVSEDETIAAGAFSYDDTDYGRISMVYVAALSDDGEDILFMNIDVYHDLMEDIDYAILSDLSDLINISITDLYSSASEGLSPNSSVAV